MKPEHSWKFAPAPHPNVLAVDAFADNYLWLAVRRDSGGAAVVDPGDADAVQAALEREGLRLEAILLTHHHGDHVGGVGALAARWGAKVWGPAGEPIDGIDQRVRGGDRVELPSLGLSLEVIDVPGHTRGHVAYFTHGFGADPRPLLFCGDTLFAAGCGRLFEGTATQMLGSLERLAQLPPDTLVFCAHEYTVSNLHFAAAVEPDEPAVGERLREAIRMRELGLRTVPSSIAIERATNPFLRCGLPGPREAARARWGAAPASDVETFAALREWKNSFRQP